MENSSEILSWSAEWEARYRESQREKAVKGCRLLLVLGLLLFPCFSVLDLITHSEALAELSLIRFSTTFVLFLVFLAQLKGWFPVKKHPVVSAVSILAFASLSITLMCIQLDGYRSEYYAGVNLVVLAAGLVIPWKPSHMAGAVGVVIFIYLAGVSLTAGAVLEQPELLFSNLAFLVGTGVIGVVSARLAERNRRESFHRLLTLEEARTSLASSREVLAQELEGGQKSLETLATEITSRKQELESALTKLQSAEAEARQSLLVRDNFLSIASHELKTPLTSLSLQLQMASRYAREYDVAPAISRALEIALTQLKRITSLTEDLLDVTRIASGQLQLRFEPLDLSELARQVVDQHRHLLSAAGIELVLDAPEVAMVEGDRERLEQVIVNLLTNASKYGRGQPVRIAVQRGAKEMLVTVEDRGIGISEENLHKIFERFERADATSGVSGLGLGLYISRNIVKSHQGEILVKSERGKGATFTVKLPARAEIALTSFARQSLPH